MIDLHCHILPNVDDGARSLADSLAMAQVAVDEGITHILCTPHYRNGQYINMRDFIVDSVADLQAELEANQIPLKLFEGQEVRIHEDLLDHIAGGEVQFLDLGKRYLLIEFPTKEIPDYTMDLFENLRTQEIVPIIVHPERNFAVMDDPNVLASFIEMGCFTQLTAGSYVGKFGRKIEKLSEQLLAANLVHFIASDAHNTSGRGFFMKEAYEKIEKKHGREKSEAMQQLTKDLINGEIVTPGKVSVVKKRMGLF